MIRVGLQLPGREFATMAALAATAERNGFDSVWAASYTLLCALAASTSVVRLGTLVTDVTCRNPAIIAKQATTLDVISRGRAVLGIGAEDVGSGPPTVAERMGRLEEALYICRAMFREQRPTFHGRYYRVDEAVNRPPAAQVGGPPILVGSRGDARALELAARYADAVNLACDREDIGRCVAVLARHVGESDRDLKHINTTWSASAVVGRSVGDAEAAPGRTVVGTPEAIAEQVLDAAIAPGLDGVILDFPGHDAGTVAGVGAAVRKAVDAAR